MRLVGLALMFTGCATAEWTVPMKEAPSDVPFCDGAPAKIVEGEAAGRKLDVPGVRECTALITRYPGLNAGSWDGVIDFKFTVAADGSVADVCVKGGTFGDVPDYVSCVGSKVKQLRGLAPGRHGWRLVFVME